MKKIIVIGNGLAGLAAAIAVTESGHQALLVSPFPPARSQSILNNSGIAAAMQQPDSLTAHCEDILAAARGLANPVAVEQLVQAAPALVQHLAEEGVPFDRTFEGNLALHRQSGHNQQRIATAGLHTGKQLITALEQSLRRTESLNRVQWHTGCRFVRPILADGHCAGAVLLHVARGEFYALTADAVIAACGGMNDLFGRIAGCAQSDGGATAALFCAGAKLANPELVQFHPLALDTPAQPIPLPLEALQMGGKLYVDRDGIPWNFLDDKCAPDSGTLSPDALSRALYTACQQAGQAHAWLDLSAVSTDDLQTKLFEITRLCATFLGVHPQAAPLPVLPLPHRFLGGLYVDAFHRTPLPGLYAAGHCCCQYHGAALLPGHAALAALYGGGRAAATAVRECTAARDVSFAAATTLADVLGRATRFRDAREGPFSLQLRAHMQSIVSGSLGPVRTEASLREGIHALDWLIQHSDEMQAGKGVHAAHALDTHNLLLLAKAALHAALSRKESRGVHVRKDFPLQDDEHYARTTVAALRWRDVALRYQPLLLDKSLAPPR